MHMAWHPVGVDQIFYYKEDIKEEEGRMEE